MLDTKVVKLTKKKHKGGSVKKTDKQKYHDELLNTVLFLKKLKTDYFRNYSIEQVYTRINTQIDKINKVVSNGE